MNQKLILGFWSTKPSMLSLPIGIGLTTWFIITQNYDWLLTIMGLLGCGIIHRIGEI